MDLNTLLAHPIVAGAVSGIMAAAAVDLHAFRSWKSWHEAGTYGWTLAAFRWFQGAVIGALTAAGYGGLIA